MPIIAIANNEGYIRNTLRVIQKSEVGSKETHDHDEFINAGVIGKTRRVFRGPVDWHKSHRYRFWHNKKPA